MLQIFAISDGVVPLEMSGKNTLLQAQRFRVWNDVNGVFEKVRIDCAHWFLES
jgi:hypothetical protein